MKRKLFKLSDPIFIPHPSSLILFIEGSDANG